MLTKCNWQAFIGFFFFFLFSTSSSHLMWLKVKDESKRLLLKHFIFRVNLMKFTPFSLDQWLHSCALERKDRNLPLVRTLNTRHMTPVVRWYFCSFCISMFMRWQNKVFQVFTFTFRPFYFTLSARFTALHMNASGEWVSSSKVTTMSHLPSTHFYFRLKSDFASFVKFGNLYAVNLSLIFLTICYLSLPAGRVCLYVNKHSRLLDLHLNIVITFK